MLAGHADEDTKDNWLPRIAGGQALVVLAYQERKARYRLDVCEAKATKAGDGWTVSGTKSLVPAGDEADAFIVPAQADGKIALFLVERAASGVAAHAATARRMAAAPPRSCSTRPLRR